MGTRNPESGGGKARRPASRSDRIREWRRGWGAWRRIVGFGLLVLVLGACTEADKTAMPAVSPTATGVPTRTQEPTATPVPREFIPADCQFDSAGSDDVACGYLLVPEDRTEPDGAMVRLHVAILRSSGETPRSDPVVHLSGGPGAPSLDSVGFLRGVYHKVLEDREVVLFDQRGVGHSEPSLDCPEYAEAGLQILTGVPAEEELVMIMDSLRTCRDRLLASGVNLSSYHSAASAADVVDLMGALGYENYNLFGISYGTRLALTIMRDHPAGIRSVVLDSAVPLQVSLHEQNGLNLQRALDLLFERCAADKSCAEKYPALEETYYALIEQFNRESLPIAFGGTTYQVSGELLVFLTIRAMYDVDAIVLLPKRISELAEGSTGWLSQQIGEIFFYWSISEGANRSSICSEELPFNSSEVIERNFAGIHPALVGDMQKELDIMYAVCDLWDVVPAGVVETQAVSSGIPTLILSGDYDPITPPAFGSMAAESLTNATHFVFPGLSHGVVRSRRCGAEIMEAFLDAPDVRPDSSCIDALKIGFLTH